MKLQGDVLQSRRARSVTLREQRAARLPNSPPHSAQHSAPHAAQAAASAPAKQAGPEAAIPLHVEAPAFALTAKPSAALPQPRNVATNPRLRLRRSPSSKSRRSVQRERPLLARHLGRPRRRRAARPRRPPRRARRRRPRPTTTQRERSRRPRRPPPPPHTCPRTSVATAATPYTRDELLTTTHRAASRPLFGRPRRLGLSARRLDVDTGLISRASWPLGLSAYPPTIRECHDHTLMCSV